MFKSYQLWSELVLTVPMSQSAVASLAPRVELSTGRDAGAVSPTTGDVCHLLTPQALYDSRTVALTVMKTEKIRAFLLLSFLDL